MQKITYNEKIQLKNKINELQTINIDDKLEQSSDCEILKITGKIQINGITITDDENETFSHQVDVDISISKEQLIEDKVDVTIEDFDYTILDNYIDINLIMKIDGLKEIEPYFPSKEDQEVIEIEDSQRLDDSPYNDSNTVKENQNNLINDLNEKSNIVENKNFSLLKQIFRNKTFKNEIAFKFHVVKSNTNYQEIAKLYDIDEDTLKSINNNENIYIGKLILIPNK